MVFDYGTIGDFTEAGDLKGIQKEVAILTWSTSTGRIRPLSIKAMTDKGTYIKIPVLEVITSEDKRYSGIDTRECVCKILLYEREVVVKLVLNKLESKWRLVEL